MKPTGELALSAEWKDVSPTASSVAGLQTATQSRLANSGGSTTDARSKKHCFHSAASKSVFLLLRARPGPSVVDESLITLVDCNRTAGFLFMWFDSDRRWGDGGGLCRRRKQGIKLYKWPSDRKSLTNFILDEKRLRHKLVYRSNKLISR